MEMQSTTLKQALSAASQAEEQPPLLSHEEILAILRKAESKKTRAVPISRSNTLPRIWKITVATLSAAAIIVLFFRISGSNRENLTVVQTLQEREGNYSTKDTQSEAGYLGQSQKAQQQLGQKDTAGAPLAELSQKKILPTIKKSIQSEYAAASGGLAATPPAMSIKVENTITASDEILKENTSKIEDIIVPGRIEAIAIRHINEPEIALGITFDEPKSPVRQSAESSASALSLNRSFVPDNGTSILKNERLSIHKNSLGADDTPQTTRPPQRTLIETLLDAAISPQMVTLVRNGEIVANEWRHSAEIGPDRLQPVYMPLNGKEAAKETADYALLWLPHSVRNSSVENGVSVTISPNPMEKHDARLSVYMPHEAAVSIAIYDMFGKKIQDIAQTKLMPKGMYYQDITVDIPDGIYVVAIIGANGSRLAYGRFVVERTQGK